MTEFELRSRNQPERVESFQPEDHPALWQLTEGNEGLGALRRVDKLAVVNMFIPEAVRDQVAFDRNKSMFIAPSGGHGRFELSAYDGNYHVELSGYIVPKTDAAPTMLSVSDYSARFPMERGSQAFYHNLGYQLAHMDVPVIYGQKIPTSLGYFIHRVGQVPVALLSDEFDTIRERIQRVSGRSNELMLKDFPSFSYTIQIYNRAPGEIVKPEYRSILAELQHKFDSCTAQERTKVYPNLVKQAFHLT